MVGSVAVLSDIHGVLPALDAVLAEPDVEAAERIVLTGDMAAGPQPVRVLDRLRDLGERAVWVRGNADRELAEYRRGRRPATPDPIAAWAAQQLREDQVDTLAALPTLVTMPIDGLGTVLFCHATPRADDEIVLVDSSLARWGEVLAGVPRRITTVVCGHTHMPFVRIAHARLIVNPGSVGMPYGGFGAHWALLGPGASLRNTLFDADAACTSIASGSAYPDAAAWADDYIRARVSDSEALAAFGRRDGRP